MCMYFSIDIKSFAHGYAVIILKLEANRTLWNEIPSSYCEIALNSTQKDPIDDDSKLVEVMSLYYQY